MSGLVESSIPYESAYEWPILRFLDHFLKDPSELKPDNMLSAYPILLVSIIDRELELVILFVEEKGTKENKVETTFRLRILILSA